MEKGNRLTHISADGHLQMVNVALKPQTLRGAIASCHLKMAPKTLQALKEKALPKGDALTLAQVAGIQGAKQTPYLIPLCHTIPVQEISVNFSFTKTGIKIVSRVDSIASTGPEMEALTACTVAALALYDMCKSIDKNLVIEEVKLEEKFGGKSSQKKLNSKRRAVVLTLSDRAFQGIYKDESGPIAKGILEKVGFHIVKQKILPDDLETITDQIDRCCEILKPDLLLTLGGTGISPRDVAPEATQRVIERTVPGIAEMLRNQSYAHHPASSFLSRSGAGLKGKTLILNLPGKPSAIAECLNLLTPSFEHIFQMIRGEGHE